MNSVKSNIEFSRMEQAESRARQDERARARQERLMDERRMQRQEMAEKRAAEMDRVSRSAEKVRENKRRARTERAARKNMAKGSKMYLAMQQQKNNGFGSEQPEWI